MITIESLNHLWAIPAFHRTVMFFAVMASMFLADMAWTRYFIATEKRNALMAANWSAMIILLGSFTTLEYVDNKWNIVAALLGSFAGTYWTVHRQAKDEAAKKATEAAATTAQPAALAITTTPMPGAPPPALVVPSPAA